MKTKICSSCKEIKPINKFGKNKTRKNGKHYYCKKCVNLKSSEWEKRNPEKVKKMDRNYRKNNPIKTWCRNTISSHKQSGYKVLFTAKDLYPIAKQTKNCPICNVLLKRKSGKRQFYSPNLDRKDNGDILTLNNIWIICNKCNVTKSNRTMKEFAYYCTMVSDKFKQKEFLK